MESNSKLPAEGHHGMTIWTRGALAAGLALSMLMIFLPGNTSYVSAQEDVTFCLVSGETRETITLLDTVVLDDEGNLLDTYGEESFLGSCEEAVIELEFDERLDPYSGEIVPKGGGEYALGAIDDDDDDDDDEEDEALD